MWGKKNGSLLEEARALSESRVRATLANRESIEREVARERRKVFCWAVFISFVVISTLASIVWIVFID